jgi:Thiamine pyrophosphate enzyme, C-terminal TPP binding domain
MRDGVSLLDRIEQTDRSPLRPQMVVRAVSDLIAPDAMAPGLPFAIAAQFAYPNRQSVAIVGAGGFAMLMAELSTALQHRLPVKIIVLKNNSLSEVRFERTYPGYPYCPSILSLSPRLAARTAFAVPIRPRFDRRLKPRSARRTRRWWRP